MRNRSWMASVAVSAALWLGGCGVDRMLNLDSGGERPAASKKQVTPEDFDRQPNDAPRVVITPPQATGATATDAIAAPAAPTDPAPANPAQPAEPRGVGIGLTADDAARAVDPTLRRDEIVVDAMVGQVTGKPVYASQIFQRIGVEQLERLGQTLPRLEFKRQVTDLILSTLQSQITSSLILAQAESGLNEQQQMGLLGYMHQKRAELLAEYGGGVPNIADTELRRRTGRGLDETVEEFRQKLLTDKFMQEKLIPKINVNRREVERYYLDHADEFAPETTVEVRVIIVTDAGAADTVDKALADGTPFADAAKKHSRFRASDGGLLPEQKLTGPLTDYKELSWNELNEQVAQLRQGERSNRVVLPGANGQAAWGWVYLEKLTGGEGKTLEQAQLQIENRIRSHKFSQLSRKYIAELMATGNYTSPEQMTLTLLEVAMARFARPQ